MRGEPFDTLESLCREILVKTEKMNPFTTRLIWDFDSLKFHAEQILDEIVSLNRQENDFKDFNCVLSHTSIDEPEDLRDDWPHAISVPGGAWLSQQ